LAAAEELSVNGFRTVMEIDAIGSFNMCRASFPALVAAKDSRLINISATLHYGATWYQVLPIQPCCVLITKLLDWNWLIRYVSSNWSTKQIMRAVACMGGSVAFL
jgi:NAD(P)-dependent dehydrogenase (short-subunit alcohol dehydrogenase family)